MSHMPRLEDNHCISFHHLSRHIHHFYSIRIIKHIFVPSFYRFIYWEYYCIHLVSEDMVFNDYLVFCCFFMDHNLFNLFPLIGYLCCFPFFTIIESTTQTLLVCVALYGSPIIYVG